MTKKQKVAERAPEKRSSATPKGKKPPRAGFFQRNSFSIVLFLLSFVVYFNSIDNKYALDDEFYTAGANKLTQKGIKGIPEIFKTRTFYNNDGSGYSYRPMALTAFAIEIQFFGEDPQVSHFFNVLLYALTMVILFALLRRWFKAQGDWFAFFVCLIFLVHPIHTEVVDNIKCRDELLTFMFAVLSMLFIWKHHESGKLVWFILFPICYFAASISKSSAIPFLALIPITLWFFMDVSWKKRFQYIVPLLLMAVLNVVIQKMLLPPQSRTYQPFENPLPGHPGFDKLTATGFYVLGRYLGLHFFPHPLVYYYGFRYVPLADWTNLLSIISLIVHVFLGIVALRELRKKSILGFGLAFYLVNIAAYSNLLRPAPGLMAERFAYSSSLGFCVVLVWAIFKLLKTDPAEFRWKLNTNRMARTVFLLLALVFMVRDWWRNGDWKNKQTLYTHDIRYTGESAKANMLLGSLLSMEAMQRRLAARNYKEQGNQYAFDTAFASAKRLFEESRTYYQKAGEVAPYYHTAWSNLGTTYFFLENPMDTSKEQVRIALSYFKKAVGLKPDYQEGLFNVGMAYDKLGRSDSAIYFFNRSIASDSTYVAAYEQLGRVYVEKGQPQEALALMQTAARKKPDSETPWNNIAKIYLGMGDTISAAGATEMAAKINPANQQRLYNLANYFRLHGDNVKYNYYIGLLQEQQRLEQEKGGEQNNNGQPQQRRRRR